MSNLLKNKKSKKVKKDTLVKKKLEIGAKKHSDHKLKISLLPLKGLAFVLEVSQYGAKKYGDHNYRKGRSVSDWIDAAYRHTFGTLDNPGFMLGIDLDSESNLPHLAHAAWNLLSALEQQIDRQDLDNRVYKKETK